MDSTVLWQIIWWIALSMFIGMCIITMCARKNKMSLEAQEVWVNSFKDISTVIVIPIILEILGSDKNIFDSLVPFILFIIIIIWCDSWPFVRKGQEKNKDSSKK